MSVICPLQQKKTLFLMLQTGFSIPCNGIKSGDVVLLCISRKNAENCKEIQKCETFKIRHKILNFREIATGRDLSFHEIWLIFFMSFLGFSDAIKMYCSWSRSKSKLQFVLNSYAKHLKWWKHIWFFSGCYWIKLHFFLCVHFHI